MSATWKAAVDEATRATGAARPSDAQVLGAVNRRIGEKGTVVCAAGGLPGELHKLWRAQDSDAYHVEYGYSCMGYEIAGGLGVKLARPDRDVVVLVGDGSYLMMNSEIATSIALGLKLTLVLLDNRGFGCINRLQGACGGEPFNNLLDDESPAIDFVAHARSLGAHAEKVNGIAALEAAFDAREAVATHLGHRDRHRPGAQHGQRRRLVGRGGARSLRQRRSRARRTPAIARSLEED